MNDVLEIIHNDALSALRELPDESVQCVVTSPPYFGLRDYGVEPCVWDETVECEHEWQDGSFKRRAKDSKPGPLQGNGTTDRDNPALCALCGAWRGCLGLEPTPEMYVAHLVQIFREARRALRIDGTLWLNIGDSYNAYNGGAGPSSKLSQGAQTTERPQLESGFGLKVKSLKPKDLIGIPWMLAFALRADGWYLRSDIIWAKPNPMPESVTDRPTRSHEYIFLLTKSARYYYNADAIKEPVKDGSLERLGRGNGDSHKMIDGAPGQQAHSFHQPRENVRGHASGAEVPYAHNSQQRHGNQIKPVKFGGNKADGYGARKYSGKEWNPSQGGGGNGFKGHSGNLRADGTPFTVLANKRDVWTVTTKPFSDAHFAVFPAELITPCILAGSKSGDVVLDPFAGSGTTGKVAIELGRKAILIEPKAEYIEMIKRRTQTTMGLPLAM